MDSFEMKTKLLHYWRFKRRYIYSATEAGKFKSDVLVSNEKEIVEIEVKTTFQNLKDDFLKKKKERKKHEIYSAPTVWYAKFLPNKFYFAIPKELVTKTVGYLSQSNYGIIEVSNKKITNSKKVFYCKIIKKASIMNPHFNEKLQHQIILRMGSEIIRLRMELDKAMSYS